MLIFLLWLFNAICLNCFPLDCISRVTWNNQWCWAAMMSHFAHNIGSIVLLSCKNVSRTYGAFLSFLALKEEMPLASPLQINERPFRKLDVRWCVTQDSIDVKVKISLVVLQLNKNITFCCSIFKECLRFNTNYAPWKASVTICSAFTVIHFQ